MPTTPKKLADIRGQAIKDQTTDLDNVKSFSAEGKDFRGLNKTVRVPFPKPKVTPGDRTTYPGSAPDNGRLKESSDDLMTNHRADMKKIKDPKVKLDNTVKGLKRRMKNSGGNSLLKPQAEAYDGGAPNTGNNNYAQSLPVPAGTKKTNMNKKLRRDTIPNASTTYESDVIMSLSDLDSIFEEFINEQDPCWKGYKQVGEKEKNGKKVPNCVPVKEELKVGEKEDVDGNNEAKKVRGTNAKGPGTGKVARKYLGKVRGTTATGKPAHRIITEPVIGEKDKNWNKTTPSGDRKK
jgi:hypothetical protein